MMAGFFQIRLPHGIVRDGKIYTVLSPIDVKAGTKDPSMRLYIGRASAQLAFSCTTSEWTRLNLGLNSQEVSSNMSATKRDISERFLSNLTFEHLEDLLDDYVTLKRVFHEDRLHRKLSDEEETELEKEKKEKLATLGQPKKIEPYRFIMRCFDPSSQRKLSAYVDHNEILNSMGGSSDYSSLERDVERFAEREFPKLGERVLAHYAARELGMQSHYPTLDSDILKEMVDTYLKGADGFLFNSWGTEKPVKIMAECKKEDKDQGIVRLNEGRHSSYYKPIASFPESYFMLLMDTLTASAITNSMDIWEIRSIDMKDLFPMDFGQGHVDLVGPKKGVTALKAVIDFPHYFMVDIKSPESVMLMKPGRFTFHLSSAIGSTVLSSYEVKELDQKPYEHFFCYGGTRICGFDPIVDSPSLSSAVWENYHLALAVLTDGLKYEHGLDQRPICKREGMTVHGHEFKTRYMPRSEAEAFNSTLPPEKRLYIGDGRAK